MYRVRFWSKSNKYNARRCEYGGLWYASNGEANYARDLDLRKKAGDIIEWERQRTFPLFGKNGSKICDYRLDFVVYLKDGSKEYVEYKGFETDVWKMKWKLFVDNYGSEPGVSCAVVK